MLPARSATMTMSRRQPAPVPNQRTGYPTGQDGQSTPKAQRNLTDGESRIMKSGDGYVQAYNCQLAVDGEHQVIVGQLVTNQPPDCEHLPHVFEEVARNCGEMPKTATADS